VRVARFLLDALDALLEHDGVSKFEALVRGCEPALHEALRESKLQPADVRAGWPWEAWRENVGPDGVPAFSGFLLDLARELLEHGRPVMRWLSEAEREGRNLGEFEVRLPDRRLLARSRAGRVAWLSVAPLPRELAALDVQTERVHADPEMQRVEVLEHRVLAQDGEHERVERFAPRSSQGDEILRGLVREYAPKCPTLGAVVNKADHEALGDVLGDRLVHYGAGHAGTDALAGCAVLILRRFVPPYAELVHEAAAWRQLLGLPPSTTAGKLVLELRRWNEAHEGVWSWVPADPLERELLEAHEAHYMLNACGRGRPLSASTPRRVLVLNGVPFNLHGASVTVRQLDEFVQAEGLALDLPTEDARRVPLEAHNADKAAPKRELLARAQPLFKLNPMASRRWLVAQLGVTEKQAREIIAATRHETRAGLGPKFATLLALLDRRRQIGPTSDREEGNAPTLGPSIHRGADLPTPDEVRRELACEMDPRTFRRHFDAVREAVEAGSPLVPARSDAAIGLDLVLSALVRLLEAREAAPALAPAGVLLPLSRPVLRQAAGLELVFDSPPLPKRLAL
jgi:hypothetical protein